MKKSFAFLEEDKHSKKLSKTTLKLIRKHYRIIKSFLKKK
jgi:hypothetical protein